jgi:hypothetical protein
LAAFACAMLPILFVFQRASPNWRVFSYRLHRGNQRLFIDTDDKETIEIALLHPAVLEADLTVLGEAQPMIAAPSVCDEAHNRPRNRFRGPTRHARTMQSAQCFGSTTDTNAVEPPGAAKLATSAAIAFHSGVAVTDFKTSGLSNHISVMR